MKQIFIFLMIIHALTISAQRISDYNVVWNSPSESSDGLMPLGNGEMGLNVRVEKNGELLFYISRTDAISEVNRIMKIGRVRLSVSPNPFDGIHSFSQKLLLEEGVIEICADDKGNSTTIRFYMDLDHTVAYMTYESERPARITTTVESWRRQTHSITKEKDTAGESASAWVICGFPDSLHFEESADVFLNQPGAIVWCHQNSYSVYDFTMRHQELEGLKSNFPDPIKDRIFGGYITAGNLAYVNDSTFQSKGAIRNASLKITTHSSQAGTKERWLKEVKATDTSSSSAKALASTKKWWTAFWDRSYVFVDIPTDNALGFKITQSYITQRFMAACCGRGYLPIRFNGSIFTPEPQLLGRNYTPDFRLWGSEYWWQNTRLIYTAMLQSADFDMMHPFFEFYLSRMNAFRTLASTYYEAKGLFIPETVTLFGTYSNKDYGWDRTGISRKEVTNKYVRWIWTQSLELSKILLDYVSYTNNKLFLTEKVLPFIHEALLYFDSRFIDENGKMRITPTQSIEMYWDNVVNDMPVVAGLHCITEAVAKLPADAGTIEQRLLWTKIASSLPPLPTRSTVAGTVFLPAQIYLNSITNSENPELYAIYPYELVNFTTTDKETGILTFKNRLNKNDYGWGQDGQIAALLGLTDYATESLLIKVANKNTKFRFPAMWGPNYDWLPDQCHGSNLLMNLQLMLMQSFDDKIYLLPAWNKDWNVSFKLAGKNHTVVKGRYKNGNLEYEKISGTSDIIPME